MSDIPRLRIRYPESIEEADDGLYVSFEDALRLEHERDAAVVLNALQQERLYAQGAEIASLKSECDHRDEGIAAWREKCREAENEIARLTAEVDRLSANERLFELRHAAWAAERAKGGA